MDKDEILFSAKDPLNREIILSYNTYYNHIISSDQGHQAHPEFSPAEIKDAIESPEVIYESSRPDSDVFFGKTCTQYPSLYLKVPVVLYSDYTGEVSTAFLSRHISGGINEGGLKYVKHKL